MSSAPRVKSRLHATERPRTGQPFLAPSGQRGKLPRMDHLTVQHLPEGLRRPILIMAFPGWNDAAEAASTAARYLATTFQAEKFAEIDPEEFYHFGLTRPLVRYRADDPNEREVVWPATEFSVTRSASLPRDLIVGVAAEPHLRWKTYCGAVLELARRCGVTLVLTLGALLAEVPHTRPCACRHRHRSRAARAPRGAPVPLRGPDRHRRCPEHRSVVRRACRPPACGRTSRTTSRGSRTPRRRWRW